MNIRVLVVEDNADYAESLRRLLALRTDCSYSIDIAGTIAAAVAKLKSDGIEVVLLDLGLPDCNGLAAIRRVVEAGVDVAIVVLTGWSGPEIEAPAKSAGADAVLIKPVEIAKINETLQYLVIHRRWDRDRHEIETALKEIGQLVLRAKEIAEAQPEKIKERM